MMMMMRRMLNMDMDRQMMMMRRTMNMDQQMMMMRSSMMKMDTRRRRNLTTIPLGRNLKVSGPPIRGRNLNLNLSSSPLGFSFCPSDEELLTVYLKNKLLNKPLPLDANATKSSIS